MARSEAESNAKTPAGKRYEGVLVGKIEDWLRPSLQRCARDESKEELISFDALVRVSAEGKAEEILFRPETAVARCVAPDFRDASYPAPAAALVVGERRGPPQIEKRGFRRAVLDSRISTGPIRAGPGDRPDRRGDPG